MTRRVYKKKGDNRRDQHVSVLLSKTERELVRLAAAKIGLTDSSWSRLKLLEAAKDSVAA